MTDVARTPINSRKAMAGKYLLEGLSLKQALIRAGYAESTASTPKQHDLSAEACLREAGKLDPEADPRTLLSCARNTLLQKLQSIDPRKESLSSVARVVDIAEKHYRHIPGQIDARGPGSFVQRARAAKVCLDELERRGLLDEVGGVGARILDVEVLDVEPESTDEP